MLALSQATSEWLLAAALEAAGGEVERGVKMVECRNVPGGVEAVLEPTAGGPREVPRCSWLLAADGAWSTTAPSPAGPIDCPLCEQKASGCLMDVGHRAQSAFSAWRLTIPAQGIYSLCSSFTGYGSQSVHGNSFLSFSTYLSSEISS